MAKIDPTRYSITVRKEDTEDGTLYVGRVDELPDVAEYGESFNEVYGNLLEIISALKDTAEKKGLGFPEPDFSPEREFSGRLPIRTTRLLHRSLALEAEKQGVSLNHYVNYLLTNNFAVEQACKAVDQIGQSVNDLIIEVNKVTKYLTSTNLTPGAGFMGNVVFVSSSSPEHSSYEENSATLTNIGILKGLPQNDEERHGRD